MENGLSLLKPSETLRKKLLAEEQRLRKKQPEHWAKTKYRKFANTVKVGAELFGATLITEKDSKAQPKTAVLGAHLSNATLAKPKCAHLSRKLRQGAQVAPAKRKGTGAKKRKARTAKAARKKKKR